MGRLILHNAFRKMREHSAPYRMLSSLMEIWNLESMRMTILHCAVPLSRECKNANRRGVTESCYSVGYSVATTIESACGCEALSEAGLLEFS